MLFLIIFFSLLFVGGGVMISSLPQGPVRNTIERKRQEREERLKSIPRVMSWAGKQIIAKNAQLPAEHQIADLEPVIRALDVKHTIAEVNKHFVHQSYGYDAPPSWDHYCAGRCRMGKYKEIYEGLNKIQENLKTQEHQKKVLLVADDLKRVDDIIKTIEQEAEFIGDTTLAITTGY
jgi:hypothetical protein